MCAETLPPVTVDTGTGVKKCRHGAISLSTEGGKFCRGARGCQASKDGLVSPGFPGNHNSPGIPTCVEISIRFSKSWWTLPPQVYREVCDQKAVKNTAFFRKHRMLSQQRRDPGHRVRATLDSQMQSDQGTEWPTLGVKAEAQGSTSHPGGPPAANERERTAGQQCDPAWVSQGHAGAWSRP